MQGPWDSHSTPTLNLFLYHSPVETWDWVVLFKLSLVGADAFPLLGGSWSCGWGSLWLEEVLSYG